VSAVADERNWLSLPLNDKAVLYSAWGQDERIGGVLMGFMSLNEVHRYIKDTLIKTYATNKIKNPSTTLAILGLPSNTSILKTYIKPPGLLLEDRRVIAWSIARDWKTTIMAVYERAYCAKKTRPYAAVLFGAEGKFADRQFRTMATDAGTRLGIEQIIWRPT
jgi:hypothetical protein